MNKQGNSPKWIQTIWIASIFFPFLFSNSALSQVTPDNTLGEENSVVNPRDESSDSIAGGAIRGQNLFHSFQEFN